MCQKTDKSPQDTIDSFSQSKSLSEGCWGGITSEGEVSLSHEIYHLV